MSVRRSASLAVAAIGFVTLAACSSSSSSSGSPGSAASSPAQAEVDLLRQPAARLSRLGHREQVLRVGDGEARHQGGDARPDRLQVNDQFVLDRISQAIAQNYNALMAVPITPSAYEPLFQRAKSQGMEIATLNTGTATKDQNLEVGTDYGTQGAKVAANIGMRPGQQNVGIITNAPGGIGDVIINAFKSHLPPNVKVVATAFDSGDPSKTVDVAEQLLTAHPETNILFSWEGTAVAGITAAIKEKGKVGHVFGVVNDLTPQVVDGIRGGTIYGTSRQHFCDMAKKAVDLLVAVSQGKQVPPTTDTGTTFVTKGNLDTVLAEAKDES